MNNQIISIAKHFEFEAGHQLPDEECYGKCSMLHGHTYKLTVEIEGKINEKGWVINFKDLKKIVNEKVIDKLDHTFLNELIDLPTAENILVWILGMIEVPITLLGCKIKSLTLYETSNSYAKINC